MNIIKLDAIDSTNSYIKKLAVDKTIDSYTVVVAKYQTSGRGQRGTSWFSEFDKNLTFSILIKFNLVKVTHQFYLSMAISLGIVTALSKVVKTSFYIKWPNDILAEKNKVAGILIENILNGDLIRKSVVGIGVNVNQENFPESIKNVTSLKNILGVKIPKDYLLKKIVSSIQFFVNYVEKNEFEKLKKMYLKSLYKYETPMMFKDSIGGVFLGKIVDISENGRLVIEVEDGTIRKFNLKEIKFADR